MRSLAKYVVIFVFVLTVFIPSKDAHAVFLLLQEISGESVGQAGMLTAAGGRPSTQYHNASNLSYVDDLALEFAFSLYMPMGAYENTEGERTEANFAPEYAPHVFTSFEVIDWLTIGFAFFPNYGIILDWPEGWEGEHLVLFNSVKSSTLNPNISFGPFKGFSIAVGFDATWSRVETRRKYTVGYNQIGEEEIPNKMTMIGHGWGFGGNAGLSYQPADWVRIGLGYRSTYTLNFEGALDFDVTSAWAWRLPDQDFKLEIQTPHQVSLGARFWPTEGLSVEMDLWYFSWSVYKTRAVQLDKGVIEGPTYDRMTDEAVQNLKDGVLVGVGCEYWFLKNFVWRGGISYSSNVQPDEAVEPIQPDGHRINFGTGFGTEWYGFYADIAYLFGYIIPHEVGINSPLPGKYFMHKHVLTLSIGYHFDPFSIGKTDKTKED